MSWRAAATVAGSASTPPAVTAYLGIGSNVGNRPRHIASAVQLVRRLPSTRVTRTSHLYESTPVGLSHQPLFLNAALELHTALDPHTLLAQLKHIERSLGRDMNAVRYGPRVIDLDVLVYGQVTLDTHTLTLPHPRMYERRFVLEPLADLIGDSVPESPSPSPPPTHHTALTAATLRDRLSSLSASPHTASDVVYRVLPLSSSVFRHVGRSVVMGIVNATPDSFSDGGSQHTRSVEAAVEYALRLMREGADIVDVGGESTRPGAAEVPVDEEQRRILPLIAALHAAEPDLPISVDTRHSETARAAVAAGACMVNDVSGGAFDPSMFGVVAELGIAYCCMHARGLPDSMAAMARYENVLCVLSHLSAVCPPSAYPVLVGASRKGFIGRVLASSLPPHAQSASSVPSSSDRLCGSVACAVLAADSGAMLLRVHDVQETVAALRLVDAVKRVREQQ